MRTVPLPVTVGALSPRAQQIHRQVREFVRQHVVPFEYEFLKWMEDNETKWTPHPRLDQLKARESKRHIDDVDRLAWLR